MRDVLGKLWSDSCDIIVRESAVDPATGRTVFSEVPLHTDLPCRVSFRLSFETVTGMKDARGMATVASQSVKLFLGPEVEIPAGSKIVVRARGRIMVFARTGPPAVWDSHQEVRMERFHSWA